MGSPTNYDQLLVDAAQRQLFFKRVLGSQRDTAGKIFMAEHPFYEISDDATLQASAFQILRWLGRKPGHVQVRFGEITVPAQLSHTTEGSTILINQQLSTSPYICGTLLIRYILLYLTAEKTSHAETRLSEFSELLDEFVVWSGFGTVYLNGYASARDFHNRCRGLLLASLRVETLFAAHAAVMPTLASYIKDHRLYAGDMRPTLLPQAYRLLPQPYESDQTVVYLLHVRKALAAQRRRKLLGYATVLACGLLTAGIFLLINAPEQVKAPTARQSQDSRSLEELKALYLACERDLKIQRSQIDRDDISAIRNVEAIESRCLSQRNYYEYRRDMSNRSVE